jgi:hypothetical protein
MSLSWRPTGDLFALSVAALRRLLEHHAHLDCGNLESCGRLLLPPAAAIDPSPRVDRLVSCKADQPDWLAAYNKTIRESLREKPSARLEQEMLGSRQSGRAELFSDGRAGLLI